MNQIQIFIKCKQMRPKWPYHQIILNQNSKGQILINENQPAIKFYQIYLFFLAIR